MQTEPVQPTKERLRFGAAVRAARRGANQSQAELAILMGVSRRLISAWECGHAIPDVAEWVRLADTTANIDLLDLRTFALNGHVFVVERTDTAGELFLDPTQLRLLFPEDRHLSLVTH